MNRKRHWLVRRTPCDLPVVLLLIMLAVSFIVSPLPERSVRTAWPLLFSVALYWVMARWVRTERRLEWAWWGMIAVGATLALVGLVGMVAKPKVLFPVLQRGLARLQSGWRHLQQHLPDTFHPNVVAGALELFIPFGMGMAGASWKAKPSRRWVQVGLASGSTLVMLMILILTQSRGAYLAILVSTVAFVALAAPRWLLAIVPLFAGAIIAAGMSVGWPALVGQLISTDLAFGLEARLAVWSAAVHMVGDFGFTGVGFGCFQPVMDHFYPAPSGATAPHAHNLFLQVGVDLGLPGLVAFLALLGLAFYLAIASYLKFRGSSRWRWVALSAACLASLTGMCVHGVLDAASWGNKGAFVPWMVIAISVALYRLSHEPSSPPGASHSLRCPRQESIGD